LTLAIKDSINTLRSLIATK